jgi:phosphoenolpyruvate carboxylase
VVAELLAVARIEADYAALDEAGKRALLLRLLLRRAAAARAGAEYSEHTRKELAIFEAAAHARAKLRPAGDPPLHHQPHRER